MIEKMSKLSMVIHKAEQTRILEALQELGLVHITSKKVSSDLSISKLKTKEKIEDFLRYFKAKKITNTQKQLSESFDNVLVKFETTLKKIDEAEHNKQRLQKQLAAVAPWGDFSSELLRNLQSEGLRIGLFIVQDKVLDSEQIKKFHFEIINKIGTLNYLAIVNPDSSLKSAGAEEIILPQYSYNECQNKIVEAEEQAKQIRNQLVEIASYTDAMQAELNKIIDALNFESASGSLETHYEQLASLEGWFPSENSTQVEKTLENESGAVFLIEHDIKPEDFEAVPVLLKNSKWAKIFEPITNLFALPGYAELDLTPFFAPFFVMFFGMCLGDAGYGIAMLIATIVGFIKLPKLRPFMVLGMLLSISTVIWGVLTGTTFGLNLFEVKLPLLSDLALFPSEHMFYLALLIGLMQIFFGMFLKFINSWIQKGFLTGLSSIGWMILLFFVVVAYLSAQNAGESTFAIGNMVLDFCKSVPPTVTKVGMIVGAAMIMLFNDMQVNIFFRFGKGLWELYGITGVFGDLLSYIRLFALGISSAILGTVINSIASEFLKLGIPVLSQLLFVAFLVIGHTCNLLLACLGSFVHPLRLTFVEFYKNAGFSGGGRQYKPFKKLIIKNEQ